MRAEIGKRGADAIDRCGVAALGFALNIGKTRFKHRETFQHIASHRFYRGLDVTVLLLVRAVGFAEQQFTNLIDCWGRLPCAIRRGNVILEFGSGHECFLPRDAHHRFLCGSDSITIYRHGAIVSSACDARAKTPYTHRNALGQRIAVYSNGDFRGMNRPQVPLLSLFRVFFQIGLLSFGGGLVSWIHREVVDVRGWMSNEEFLSGMSLSQILPGINSTNTSIFVGQRLRGPVGATVAVVAMLAGPFVVILLAGLTYKTLLGAPGFPAVVEGVGDVAMGLLTRLGIQAGRTVKIGIAPALATLATFIGVGVLQWPMLAVVAVVAPLCVAAAWPRGNADA